MHDVRLGRLLLDLKVIHLECLGLGLGQGNRTRDITASLGGLRLPQNPPRNLNSCKKTFIWHFDVLGQCVQKK